MKFIAVIKSEKLKNQILSEPDNKTSSLSTSSFIINSLTQDACVLHSIFCKKKTITIQ